MEARALVAAHGFAEPSEQELVRPDGSRAAVLVGSAALAAFAEAGLIAETIGPHGGTVATSGKPMKVNRAAPNAPSVVYDAVFVPAGVGAAA